MNTYRNIFGVLALLSTVSSSAFAEKDLTESEQKLYGNHTGRVTVSGFIGSGDDLTRAGNLGKGYSTGGGDIGFDWGMFGNQTKFKTHLGGEVSTSLGFRGGRTFDDGTTTDGGLAFRVDGAFSYGVAHGDLGLPVRLTFFTGPGFTYDPDYVAEDNYAYLLLGFRGGVRVGETTDLQLQYVYVPGTTSSSYYIREHRLEGALHFGPLAAGARYQIQTMTTNDEKSSANAPRLGAFVGYAF